MSPLLAPLSSSQAEFAAPGTARETDDKKNTPASQRAKPISCLAFSPDGNYLAAGEMGHQPRILIWDVKERVLLHECRGHKFGVFSLAFSPNMRYLVSIGFQHDGYIYVWNWRKGTKLAGNKITSKVNALSFAKDGTYFVTAGLRHVKFWYLDARGRIPKRGNLSSRETQVLDGRSGILGSLRESNFVDVACDRATIGNVYFLTDNGILCMFKEGRVIDKWVDLQVKGAYSLSVSSTYVICACANGIIRLFEPETLKYCGMIPKPHPLGIDISSITSPESLPVADASTCYPDIIAVAYDESTKKVTAVYSDRSLYVWDIKDLMKVGKYRSFIAHSDCVWGVETCPPHEEGAPNSHIPPHSFVTHSADGTIRFWSLDHVNIGLGPSSSASSISHLSNSTSVSPTHGNLPWSGQLSPSNSTVHGSSNRRNIYSRELVKMLYVDTDAAEFSKLKKDVDLADDQLPDFGIRALKISSDGKLMATGDRNGNLRVHNMQTWEQIAFQEAHDSEILSIDFSNPLKDDMPCLVATGSRDRLLHIFDVKRNFQLVQSLDDHSSSITAVKFTKDADKLISCGADKGVIFRKRVTDIPVPNGCFYATYHNYSGRSTVFDMAMDVTARYVATVTGERRLYVFSIESGKPFCICKPETAEELANSSFAENSGGSLINIDLDPFSGTYAVTSGSDRCLRLFDLTNSICIDKICAHAELVTSVKFLRTSTDSLRMISTCSDGTIFVWKVSDEIVARMKARASERDTKLKQATAMGEYTTRALGRGGPEDVLPDEKRALLLGGAAKSRLRRVSTATMLRPTASLSQMIRQGERRTFSSISPSRFESPLANSFTVNESTTTNSPPTSTPPIAAHRHHRPSSTDNHHAKDVSKNPTTPPRTPTNTAGERKVPEIQGKLGRLYNGIPTSGRERLVSQVSHYPPPPSPRVIPAYGQSRHPQPRMNQVLRRQVSRDALNRKDGQPIITSLTNISPAKDSPRLRPRASETMLNKRASGGLGLYSGKREPESVTEPPGNILRTPTPPKQRRSSGGDLPRQRSVEPPVPKREIPNNVDEQDNGDEECDSEIIRHQGQGQGQGQDDNDGNDGDEEDDDEDNEEEETIYIPPTTEEDIIGNPFEVSVHDLHEDPNGLESNETNFGEDGRKSPTSDNETAQTNSAPEEDEGSSEDNVDDLLSRDIASREPNRMSTSLSRTTSMSMSARRSINLDHLANEINASRLVDGVSTLSQQSRLDLASLKDTPALRELQKKLENATKRLSITARYLSSVGQRKDSQRNSTDSTLSTVSTMSDTTTCCTPSESGEDSSTETKEDVTIAELPTPGVSNKIPVKAVASDSNIVNPNDSMANKHKFIQPTKEKSEEIILAKFTVEEPSQGNQTIENVISITYITKEEPDAVNSTHDTPAPLQSDVADSVMVPPKPKKNLSTVVEEKAPVLTKPAVEESVSTKPAVEEFVFTKPVVEELAISKSDVKERDISKLTLEESVSDKSGSTKVSKTCDNDQRYALPEQIAEAVVASSVDIQPVLSVETEPKDTFSKELKADVFFSAQSTPDEPVRDEYMFAKTTLDEPIEPKHEVEDKASSGIVTEQVDQTPSKANDTLSVGPDLEEAVLPVFDSEKPVLDKHKVEDVVLDKLCVEDAATPKPIVEGVNSLVDASEEEISESDVQLNETVVHSKSEDNSQSISEEVLTTVTKDQEEEIIQEHIKMKQDTELDEHVITRQADDHMEYLSQLKDTKAQNVGTVSSKSPLEVTIPTNNIQDTLMSTSAPATVSEPSSPVPPMTPNEDHNNESILSDLEGAEILLDSVLDAFVSLSKHADQNRAFLTILEGKLGEMNSKISQTIDNKSANIPTSTSSPTSPSTPVANEIVLTNNLEEPATLHLLEKYSTLLLKMVESKMSAA
ncbi:hypothetical protein F4703DRAFT_1762129 [Phycomyces blakesleeanus]